MNIRITAVDKLFPDNETDNVKYAIYAEVTWIDEAGRDHFLEFQSLVDDEEIHDKIECRRLVTERAFTVLSEEADANALVGMEWNVPDRAPKKTEVLSA